MIRFISRCRASIPEDLKSDGSLPSCTPSDILDRTMCDTRRKYTFTTLDSLGNAEALCDVAGTWGWNEPCGSGGASGNYQAGLICFNSVGGVLRYKRPCTFDFTCTSSPGGSHAACEIGISVGGTEASGISACSFDCDVLEQTGFDSSQGYLASFPGDYTYWTDCTTSSDGSACVDSTGSECAAGWDFFSIYSDGDTVTDYNECLEYCAYPYGSCATGTCSQGAAWPSTIGVCF